MMILTIPSDYVGINCYYMCLGTWYGVDEVSGFRIKDKMLVAIRAEFNGGAIADSCNKHHSDIINKEFYTIIVVIVASHSNNGFDLSKVANFDF